MKTDKTISQKIRTGINLKDFASSLSDNQKKDIAPLVSISTPDSLRKTVYLSSGGKYLKYADFLLEFVYKSGYVPVHPMLSLNYYLSSIAHKHNKAEIIKDCYSLMAKSDELWVFEESLPKLEAGKEENGEYKPISQFPEGVLSEIFYWLTYKPHFPIRFFTWKDIGIAKYDPNSNWSLVPEESGIKKGEVVENYPKKFAIVDLGSSTVKLSVCEINRDKNISIIHKKAITVNLAEGFFENNELQVSAMERTLQAVIDLQKEAISFGVIDLKLIGTGVLRKAKNINTFLTKIKENTGLELTVVTSKDESELIYRAVADTFKNKEESLIVVNAGGGTTEITFGKGEKIVEFYSLHLGISDLNTKFASEYPLSEEKFEQMKEYVEDILKENIKTIPSAGKLVYTGGELDYMLITGFPLEDSNLSLAHPKMISLEKVKKHSEKMRKMTIEELHNFMPSNPKWMDGANSSNAILEAISEYFKVKDIIPSNKNLNDGIILTMI